MTTNHNMKNKGQAQVTAMKTPLLMSMLILQYLLPISPCSSFSTTHNNLSFHSMVMTRRHPLKAVPFSTTTILYNDFDDLSSNNNGADDREAKAGRDLAKEFYQQVRVREEQAAAVAKEASSSEEPETYEVNNNNKKDNVKFTGREKGEIDSTGTPSAGLFARKSGSVYAFPANRDTGMTTNQQQRRRQNAFAPPTNTSRTAMNSNARLSPREEMMRSEFNLVSIASNEASLIVQGILVLLLLSFTLYVGMSGGITDGSERFGLMEGVVNDFNGLGDNLDFSAGITDTATTSVPESLERVITPSGDGGSVWL
jgi:hypothetical protein